VWPDCPTVKAVRIRNIRRESARICSLQSVVLGLNGLNLFELTEESAKWTTQSSRLTSQPYSRSKSRRSKMREKTFSPHFEI